MLSSTAGYTTRVLATAQIQVTQTCACTHVSPATAMPVASKNEIQRGQWEAATEQRTLFCLGVTFLFLPAQPDSEMLLQDLKKEDLELPHTPERKKEGISRSYC